MTAPVFIFAQLKLRAVQVTDVKGEFRWGSYYALRSISNLVALGVVAAIVALFYRDDVAPVILMIGLAKAIDGLSDLIYGQEQLRERMDHIAWSQISRGITSLIVSVAVMWSTRSTAWTAASTAGSYAAWLIWDRARLRRALAGESVRASFDREALRKLFVRVLPLGFVQAIGSLQVNIPRYFLEHHSSREDLGVFGAMAFLLVFGNMIVAALANAALPRLSRQAAQSDWTAFRSTLSRMLAIGTSLGIIGVALSFFIGEPVLRLLYSEEISMHSDVLVWLAATSGLIWSYVFLGTALDAMRKFNIQPWIHGASSLVIVVGAMVLVPTHGMHGAAWAMLVGYCVESVLYFVAVAIPLRRMRSLSR